MPYKGLRNPYTSAIFWDVVWCNLLNITNGPWAITFVFETLIYICILLWWNRQRLFFVSLPYISTSYLKPKLDLCSLGEPNVHWCKSFLEIMFHSDFRPFFASLLLPNCHQLIIVPLVLCPMEHQCSFLYSVFL